MKKILVIDDEEEICKLVKTGLERNGEYSVVLATSGQDGVLFAQMEKPDLILLDIKMPDMDGFEVLQQIKENKETGGIPVIMVTAFGDEPLRTSASHLYSEGYLVKPVDMQSIRKAIESILGKP